MPTSTNLLCSVVPLVAVLAAVHPLHGQKTDVVVLDNGDHITGEIKELQRGRLRFKTDAASTIYIEWEHVQSIATEKFLEIELVTGRKYFGSIQPSENADNLVILGMRSTADLRRDLVVLIAPIKSSFWSRLSGLIEFGFSFTKANRNTSYTLKSTVDYRAENFEGKLSGDSYLQTQEDAERVSRNLFAIQISRLLPNRWFVTGFVQTAQNSELALEIRGTLGVGPGRFLVQTNRVSWLAAAGLAGNRERFSEREATSNLELLVATDFRWFLFGDNKTDLHTSLSVLPSLTDWGRLRVSLDTSFRRDLILDFYISLNFYGEYDSRPGTGEASRNDYGVTFALGYDF